MKKLYLSGPMLAQPNQEWRQQVKKALPSDWQILDPADVVRKDLQDVGECDIILVYWPKPCMSIGTVCEMFAGWLLGKKIVLVYGQNLLLLQSPWIQCMIDEAYPSWEEALQCLWKNKSNRK